MFLGLTIRQSNKGLCDTLSIYEGPGWVIQTVHIVRNVSCLVWGASVPLKADLVISMVDVGY